jgi:hypothetical protein
MNGGYYQTFFGNEDPAKVNSQMYQLSTQVSTPDNEEVTKITEGNKYVLNQSSLQCPHCNFFTIKVQVLQSHLKKKHAREERINPTSREYFASKTQIDKNVIQPSSLKPFKAQTKSFVERQNRLSLPSGNQVERKLPTKRGRESVEQINQVVADAPQMHRAVNPTVTAFHQKEQFYNPAVANFHQINQSISPVAAPFLQPVNLIPRSGVSQVGRVIANEQNVENYTSVKPNKRGRKSNCSVTSLANLEPEPNVNNKIEEAQENQSANKAFKTEMAVEEIKPKKRGRKSKAFLEQQNLVKIEVENREVENNPDQNTQKISTPSVNMSKNFQNKKRKSDQTIYNYQQSALGNFLSIL